MSDGKHPAHIWIQDKTILYAIRDSDAWELPIAELKVVGEYTTPNGPYIDDYFYVFLSTNYWYEASFYCQEG